MKVTKKLAVSTVVAVALVSGGVAAYAHHSKFTGQSMAPATATATVSEVPVLPEAPSQQQLDEIFRNYLLKMASSQGVYTEESYQVAGSKLSGKASIDIAHKTISQLSTIDCTATIGQSSVTLNASSQTENASSYIRLNDISGTLADASGKPIYLSDVFAKAKGTWYKAADQNTAIQAQLDSGVLIFNSAVVAPGYDAGKVVDALIANKAFYATANAPENGVYDYIFSAYKAGYLAALKQAFPNLTAADQIIDSLFGDKATLSSELLLRADGTLVKEVPIEDNLCKSVVQTFIGVRSDSFSDVVSGTSTPKAAANSKVAPITSSKPADQLAQDIVF